MKESFESLLAVDGVNGVLLFSPEGRIVFQELLFPYQKSPDRQSWAVLIGSMEGICEAELIYENSRFYIRSSEAGYLLVILDPFASIDKVRGFCEATLFELTNKPDEHKGIMRFFSRT